MLNKIQIIYDKWIYQIKDDEILTQELLESALDLFWSEIMEEFPEDRVVWLICKVQFEGKIRSFSQLLTSTKSKRAKEALLTDMRYYYTNNSEDYSGGEYIPINIGFNYCESSINLNDERFKSYIIFPICF